MIKQMKDKGFSLVELIVVVLIMAIIAVALAPQILKWVNNSRVSTDLQTKDSLVGFMQTTVLTNEAAHDVAVNQGAVLIVGYNYNAELKHKSDDNPYGIGDPLYDKFCEYAGISDISGFRTKNKGTEIVITVNETATTITSSYRMKDTGDEIVIED